MYLNCPPRAQWKNIHYLLQKCQVKLVKRYVCLGVKPPMQSASCLLANRLQRKMQLHRLNTKPREIVGDDMVLKQDTIMKKLEAAITNDELMGVMTSLRRTHLVEVISLLWLHYQSLDQPGKQALTQMVLTDVLPLLDPQIRELDVGELSRCYLHLRKMHIRNCEPVVEEVLNRALLLIDAQINGEVVPLNTLSRLSVGINLERDFFTPLVCKNFIPHLAKHIVECQNEEQVRLISTCIFQLHLLVGEELLNDFKLKVRALLKNKVLSRNTPKALLKVLHMLNIPLWSQQHTHLIKVVLLTLEPCVHELDSGDLKIVCRAFLHHQEPATLVLPLKKAMEKLLKEETTADVLSCAVHFATHLQRDKYTQDFCELLYSYDAWLLPNASAHFFSVLRGLKISDLRLCNRYWSGVVRELDSSPEEQTHLRFLRHCRRYMNFNNNLGGTYRHFGVERKLSQMCMNGIEKDIVGRLPTKFARMASFVLAYGQTPFAWKKFPNILLSKLLTMSQQLGIEDCFLLSRGMHIACELRFRQHLPSLADMQMSTMDSVLIDSAERHLLGAEKNPLNASELSMIVRTLSHRKTLKNTVVYNKALSLYKCIEYKDFSSRVVRDLAYNLNASHFLIPELLESMLGYISEQHKHIRGDTVEKVVTCSYNLGYTPVSLKVMDYAADVLLRDFDQMSGLALVQACLALCFYKTIPEQLINKIFCVKFIQRTEDEIQVCYSKATYPERVLNLVMQLNRTVCLDLPEINVPWFQQNHIEAQMNKKSFQNNGFSRDVKLFLQNLLQNDSHFRCNHTTPYGYQIDFVIHFDRDKKPVTLPLVETTLLDRITKVAILLLKFDSFCENDLTALRGPDALKVKHLEMMGYKVLQINEHDWNSKYMTAPGAKCLLQISN
ncbi:hypothetical protein KR009_008984 [Drosophila setifemur]|nr:hypothetical protein KR009_008984 [Drosophila setifemur]